MKIESVYVENYRCISRATLDLSDLTVMVGRNGSGKSAFLHAVDVFYDVGADIGPEDFFNNDLARTILIRVSFAKLTDGELAEFAPYIQDQKLIVSKRIAVQDGRTLQKYYASTLQHPLLAEIRRIPGRTEQRARWNDLVQQGALQGPPPRVQNAQQLDDAMAAYEAGHINECEFSESEQQFFGPRNVGGGKLDKYTKFVYIPAVSDATSEAVARRGSSLYELLDAVVFRRIANRGDIMAVRSEFERRLAEVYSPENLTEVQELASSLNETLRRFIPGTSLELKLNPVEIPKIANPTASAMVTEDGFSGDVSRKGNGLQRGLVMTILQHLALAARGGEVAVADDESVVIPELILAVEEPELYQHPLRCRYLASLFSELATAESSTQVILTTHSPHFISLNEFESIRVLKKTALPGLPSVTEVSKFSLAEASREMARINNDVPERYTAESFRARAFGVMNAVVNEGFFADRVLLVEGLTEVAAFWAVAKQIGLNLTAEGIALIGAGGKNNLDRPAVIFRGLGVPTYFVFDGDADVEKNRDDTARRNQRYLRLGGGEVVDFPDTQVQEGFACFRDNIEGYLSETLGERFASLRDEVAGELGYSPSGSLKHFDVALEFVERAYAEGHSFDVLQRTLEKVQMLVGA